MKYYPETWMDVNELSISKVWWNVSSQNRKVENDSGLKIRHDSHLMETDSISANEQPHEFLVHNGKKWLSLRNVLKVVLKEDKFIFSRSSNARSITNL